MIPLSLTETTPCTHVLSQEQGRRLAESGIVTTTPSPFAPEVWEIAARGKVGVARVGDVEVWVEPKLPIDRLLFLVGYTTDPNGWRDETIGLDARRGLVPAVAQALWRQTERALRQGLLQGYRTVEESSYVLRGRLRENEQLRRHYGAVIPMEVRHDDFTVDIAENRIILAAITRLLAVPGIDDESRRRLTALRLRLADVTGLVHGARLPPWHPTRLNERYHTALRLAEIVWRATSPEHAPGSILANGFLFDLPLIFEHFVVTAIGEELARRTHGAAYSQYSCRLDDAGEVCMRPDLVWEQHGQPSVVIDAKYKQERPAGYPDADLYQMLAYCTALGLPHGHLVYAKGNAEPARHVVRHTQVEIICHALDLELSPADLLAQVATLVDELMPSVRAA